MRINTAPIIIEDLKKFIADRRGVSASTIVFHDKNKNYAVDDDEVSIILPDKKTFSCVEEIKAYKNSLLTSAELSLEVYYQACKKYDVPPCQDYIDAIKNKENSLLIHSESKIGPNGLKAILEALKQNRLINLIVISGGNNIGVEGCRALAEFLKTTTSITCMTISSNNFGNDGSELLAGAMEVNNSLVCADFPMNDIGDNGAIAWGKALQTNHCLKSFGLQLNQIGKTGITELLNSLLVNDTLDFVQFQGNINDPTIRKYIKDYTDTIQKKRKALGMHPCYIKYE